jgi:SPP1 family predicted phage head-tail adaptor
MPTPGAMRQRITIEVPDAGGSSADDFGQDAPAWSTVGTFWAEVRPLAGREAIVAKQLRPEATHTITLRSSAALAGLTSDARATYRGRVLNFLSVLVVGTDRRGIDVVAQEMP